MSKDNDAISISSTNLEVFDTFSKTSISKIDHFTDESNKQFGKLRKTGIYGKGFNRIEKGYSEIGQSLTNYSNVLNAYYDEVQKCENMFSSSIESIYIPSEFSLNGFEIEVNNKDIDVRKKDGKAINDDNSQNNIEVTVNSSINQQALNNIENKDGNMVIKFNDSSSIYKETLENINNSIIDKISNYDDSSKITKKDVNDISKTTTNEVDYIDLFSPKINSRIKRKNDNSVITIKINDNNSRYQELIKKEFEMLIPNDEEMESKDEI